MSALLEEPRKALSAAFSSSRRHDKAVIDGIVSFLHYRVTVSLLVSFSLLVTFKQLFGDPIACSEMEGLRQEMFDTYCWVSGTFTAREYFTTLRNISVQPGIGFVNDSVHTRVYHRYYQWVPLVLMASAARFYLPRCLWKSYEGGKVAYVIFDSPKPSEGSQKYKMSKHAPCASSVHKDFFDRAQRSVFRHSNLGYLLCHVAVQALNMANVVAEIAMTNFLLGDDFHELGHSYMNFLNADTVKLLFDTEAKSMDVASPLEQIFPKVTMCHFRQGAPNGRVINFHGICVLPLNVLNEKIYLILWFWYALLLAAGVANLVFDVVTLSLTFFRELLLAHHCSSGMRDLSAMNASRKLTRSIGVPSFFVLMQISKNVSGDAFEDLVKLLCLAIDNKSKEDASKSTSTVLSLDRQSTSSDNSGSSSSGGSSASSSKPSHDASSAIAMDEKKGESATLPCHATLRPAPPPPEGCNGNLIHDVKGEDKAIDNNNDLV